MMSNYEKPDVEIIQLNNRVVVTSGEGMDYDPNNPAGGGGATQW